MYAENSLPRLIICGAPGDGKSALLAHLLDEVEGDQLWRRAVLAHRPRALCVADIPAGERDWRSFVAAASIADAALIVVDACRESHSQAKEYLYLARLFKIRTILLAVNKMDLGAYDQTLFELVCDELGSAADGFAAVPVSAISGENVGRPSPALAWYDGPSLIEHIETVTPRSQAVEEAPFRLPVRSAACDADGHRQISGVVASGSVDRGGLLKIMPAGVEAKIDRILVAGLEVDQAAAGQAAVLSLDRPVDCSPGDVLCTATDLLEVSDQFEATIIWLAQDDLLPGRQYWLDLAGQRALATLQPPKHQVDLSSGELVPARTLGAKTVGILDLWTDSPLVFTPFSECRDLGSFSLVDRVSEEIVSAGLIHFALRRSHNIQAQLLDITPQARAAIKGQAPRLLWFTGLSGAGKSTIANLVEKKLHLMGRHTFLLDGDNVRLGLNRDLGFSDADRAENVRRVGETARLMLDAGLIVLAAFISPFRAERRMVREMLPEGRFVEIHIDVPLAEAERRDPKGLYRKARGGGIPNFTGIGSPYEPPEQAEISIDTVSCGAEEAADQIVRYLLRDQT